MLTTALFSFLYHLASYETGGEALVHCGMMESLLAVVSWAGKVPDHVTVSVTDRRDTPRGRGGKVERCSWERDWEHLATHYLHPVFTFSNPFPS